MLELGVFGQAEATDEVAEYMGSAATAAVMAINGLYDLRDQDKVRDLVETAVWESMMEAGRCIREYTLLNNIGKLKEDAIDDLRNEIIDGIIEKITERLNGCRI